MYLRKVEIIDLFKILAQLLHFFVTNSSCVILLNPGTILKLIQKI